jgi:hypothetical protein
MREHVIIGCVKGEGLKCLNKIKYCKFFIFFLFNPMPFSSRISFQFIIPIYLLALFFFFFWFFFWLNSTQIWLIPIVDDHQVHLLGKIVYIYIYWKIKYSKFLSPNSHIHLKFPKKLNLNSCFFFFFFLKGQHLEVNNNLQSIHFKVRLWPKVWDWKLHAVAAALLLFPMCVSYS